MLSVWESERERERERRKEVHECVHAIVEPAVVITGNKDVIGRTDSEDEKSRERKVHLHLR